jgi:hypothetical protein
VAGDAERERLRDAIVAAAVAWVTTQDGPIGGILDAVSDYRAHLAKPTTPPLPVTPEAPAVREPTPEPICGVCMDTHQIPNRTDDGTWACTSCPSPCRSCASDGGRGAFCATTPCACECHKGRGLYASRDTQPTTPSPSKPAGGDVDRVVDAMMKCARWHNGPRAVAEYDAGALLRHLAGPLPTPDRARDLAERAFARGWSARNGYGSADYAHRNFDSERAPAVDDLLASLGATPADGEGRE